MRSTSHLRTSLRTSTQGRIGLPYAQWEPPLIEPTMTSTLQLTRPADMNTDLWPVGDKSQLNTGRGLSLDNIDPNLLRFLIELLMQASASMTDGADDSNWPSVPSTSYSSPSFSASPASYTTHSSSGSSTSDTNTLPKDVSNGNVAQAVAKDLKDRYGLNATQIAGVLGNMQQESGLLPNVNQGGQQGAPEGGFGGGQAYGLAQWDGSRKQAEIDYAHKHGLDPGSLEANIGYMNQELDGDYSQTITDLKNTDTVEGATAVWEKDFEQAGVPEMGQRLEYAQNFLSQDL